VPLGAAGLGHLNLEEWLILTWAETVTRVAQTVVADDAIRQRAAVFRRGWPSPCARCAPWVTRSRASTLRAPENILRRASSGLPALADGGLPKLGRMRTGYSACSDSFATERPTVQLTPIHVLG
jgi:hypothetical protein